MIEKLQHMIVVSNLTLSGRITSIRTFTILSLILYAGEEESIIPRNLFKHGRKQHEDSRIALNKSFQFLEDWMQFRGIIFRMLYSLSRIQCRKGIGHVL